MAVMATAGRASGHDCDGAYWSGSYEVTARLAGVTGTPSRARIDRSTQRHGASHCDGSGPALDGVTPSSQSLLTWGRLWLWPTPRDASSRQRWIEALAAHPTLIQRPIITADDGTTVVGRSDEAVRSVLPHEGA